MYVSKVSSPAGPTFHHGIRVKTDQVGALIKVPQASFTTARSIGLPAGRKGGRGGGESTPQDPLLDSRPD